MDEISDNQLNIFDIIAADESYKEHWQDMPEFNQKNTAPYQQIIISFLNKSDVDDFKNLIKQNITYKTKSLWFPKLENEKPINFLYIQDENNK